MIGISKVMKEELVDLILRSRFGALPAEARVEGHVAFTKEDF
jgi:predicted ATP-grasp superfamily ATP-dependent carboligase